MDQTELELVSKLVHEINRSYCLALGDKSHFAWEETPESIKASCRAGVLHHSMNPETTPDESHALWLHHKVQEGWVYGSVKDIDKKTHPCLVPYTALPVEQCAKDYIFSSAVKQAISLLKSVKGLNHE